MNRGKERPQRTGSKKSAFQYKPRDEKANDLANFS
jgi:hypothetical protein